MLSSVIILLPSIFGIVMWNDLPNSMMIHWGADGIAAGFRAKAFAVFVLPAIFLVLHLVCLLFTLADKNKRIKIAKH